MPHASESDFSIKPTPWSREDLVTRLGESWLAQLSLNLPVYHCERDAFFSLLNNPEAANRNTLPAHVTTSSLVLHPRDSRTLLVFHRKYGEWVYPGGHADNDWLWLRSALRECREETGLETVDVLAPPWLRRAQGFASSRIEGVRLDPTLLLPHFVQRFEVKEHRVHEQSFPVHDHFDIVYVFRALQEDVFHDQGESEGIRWVELAALQEQWNARREWHDGIHILTAEIGARILEMGLDSL